MAYDLLYHNEFDLKSFEKAYPKSISQLQNADFKSADVRKMGNTGFYRSKLNIKDRLLFAPISYNNKTYLLLLELIKEHNYARSRFLRGAMFPPDDQLIPVPDPDLIPDKEIKKLTYLNPAIRSVHVLNKFISFDEIQDSVLTEQPPLIIIGSAGSGKTALVLEKLKVLNGTVAYISLSKFLVESASKMYYAQGYENEDQEVAFLSLSDYLAGFQKPEGKEIHFRPFEQWFNRHAVALKLDEPYRVFEEFKGVITGAPVHTAWLSEEEYFSLGVKQSVFSTAEREKLYPLFLKYLEWLKDNNYYDTNILSFQYLEKITPSFDFILVDEVQDLTNIQLKCILQSLIKKTNFILTGDSNQIVHPNFFSWSKIRTYFYQTGDGGNRTKILQTNYRNSLQVVGLSNKLLKIKNTRFGSIDKESNYLINTISSFPGEVLLYTNDDKKKNELNRRTQDSKDFAVIVPDTVHKNEAAKNFKTPLIFTVQEAKGLEYENVILANFISNHEGQFKEIIKDVTAEDLLQEELTYNRSRNKSDKDAEIYKFYINSFYVAITRAMKNIYLFETSINHPILELLSLKETKSDIQVAQVKSTREEWLEEARKLKEQGKYDQAEQILAKYLGYEYISGERLESICSLALDPSKKEQEVHRERKQLYEYAIHHQRMDWIEQLAVLKLQRAILFMKEVRHRRKEYTKSIRLGRSQEAYQVIKKYGIDFENEEGATGLMLAVLYDQKTLATGFMEQGASIYKRDLQSKSISGYLLQGHYERTFRKQQMNTSVETLKMFWHNTRPPVLYYEVQGRRFQIVGQSMLYFLVSFMQGMQELQPTKITLKNVLDDKKEVVASAFQISNFEQFAETVPEEVLPDYRKKRNYINSVLASHEISHADKPHCKQLFVRVQRGWYIINPDVKWVS